MLYLQIRKKNVKKGKKTSQIKKSRIAFLIIWMTIISNISLSFYINLNPNNTNLRQRADYFSYTRVIKTIDEDNSELIYGSETKGSVMTSIKILKSKINEEFTLCIEAEIIRIWNHTSTAHGQKYYPSKDLRIEILINGEIKIVFNYSKLPKNYYSSKMKYNNLAILNRGRRISCSEKFIASSSRKSIKIRLITNHSLVEDKNIFANYFHDDEYCITICIGDPGLIFCISSIIFFLNWFVCITFIFLKRKFYVLIDLFNSLIQVFYYEFKLYMKLKNKIKPYLKIIFKD